MRMVTMKMTASAVAGQGAKETSHIFVISDQINAKHYQRRHKPEGKERAGFGISQSPLGNVGIFIHQKSTVSS